MRRRYTVVRVIGISDIPDREKQKEGSKMKRLLILTLIVTLLIAVPSCGDGKAASGSSKASEKKVVRLSKTKLTLEVGQNSTIKLKGAKVNKVKWTSSKRSVATVSKGKIKGKKAGTAVITAKYKSRKYKCKVTVRAEKNDPEQPAGADPSENDEQPAAEKQLTIMLGETKVSVDWKNNDSVAALKELVKDDPLTIQMSMYGGFEQVGKLGTSLPRNDKETTTSAGDIVLYSGNQIVVFYGSNSWSYTRLGYITDQTASGMKKLLGNGDIKLTISME